MKLIKKVLTVITMLAIFSSSSVHATGSERSRVLKLLLYHSDMLHGSSPGINGVGFYIDHMANSQIWASARSPESIPDDSSRGIRMAIIEPLRFDKSLRATRMIFINVETQEVVVNTLCDRRMSSIVDVCSTEVTLKDYYKTNGQLSVLNSLASGTYEFRVLDSANSVLFSHRARLVIE